MKTKQTITLLGLAALTVMASCQHENNITVSGTGVISPRVSSSVFQTKGGSACVEEEQTIALDSQNNLVITEYSGDYQSLPFSCGDASTKGTVITTDNISSEYGEFGMESFLDNYDEIDCNIAYRPVLTGNDQYISGGKATYNDGEWTLADASGNAYPWLNEIQFTFWSYAPLNSKSLLSFDTTGSRQVMAITDYVNPSNAADQKDLLVAYNNRFYGESDDSETIDIEFRHALSVVYFDISAITDMTVKKISIIGAYSKGSCVVNGADLSDSDVTKAFTWTTGSTKGTFEMTSTDDKFFMIPQILPEGAAIGLTFEKDGVQNYVEKPLATTWKAGKYYKYILTYNEKLDVVVEENCSDAVKADVSVKNTGNCPAYIRAAVVANWFNDEGEIVAPWDMTEGTFDGFPGSDWENGDDGFYYYKKIVPAGENTGKLFNSYTKPTAEGMHLEMKIMAQGIKYETSETYSTAWPY